MLTHRMPLDVSPKLCNPRINLMAAVLAVPRRLGSGTSRCLDLQARGHAAAGETRGAEMLM
jgi:hypothetical protein